MCNDCQAFAFFLGMENKMLDFEGGSEIIPIHPAGIRFTQGLENLACIRLSDDGLRRWYTSCCRTPVANTHCQNRLPFAGVHRTFLTFSGDVPMGQVYARVNGKKSNGEVRAMVQALFFLSVGFIRRLNRPWPFPDVAPYVGTDSEYLILIDKVVHASDRRGG